ncbi:MAG: dienelactone hydrolase family protein [Cyanobacteria bacterium P01_F01_bin.150]
MRKFLIVIFCTTLLFVGLAHFKPTTASESTNSDRAHLQSEIMTDLHRGDSPIASPAVLSMDHLDVTAEDVTYGEIDGTPLTGYLAQPTKVNADSPFPGVIVIQEWWGLNENIEAMTQRLAAEGYTALAVDLYDDQVADTPEQARELVQAALANPDRLTQNVVAAYNYLTTTMAAPTVASLGWCFGGTWSLNTALALPDQLDAAVIYYGGGITTDQDRLVTLNMPIQGHFGLLDTNPSPEIVLEFERVLNSAGKTAQIYLYANAGHAFANPSGTRYNEAAAELAWDRTVDFLKQNL